MGETEAAATTATVGERFDLDTSSERWLWQKNTLAEGTVLQSFAFDEVNKRLYVLQLRGGDAESGDLCLNKLDYQGKHLGHMYLRGFGHGVSMGVQNAADGTVWIWTEAASNASGYGQGVTRFRFSAGATRKADDVNVRFPIPGSTNNQPSVCQATNRIAVRHRVKGVARYRVYDLDPFIAGDYTTHVADFRQVGVHPDPEIPFQGYALCGNYLYQLAGTAHEDNTYLSCVDIRTGELVQRLRSRAGRSLTYREPEGVAVRHTPTPRLHLGFASGEAGERRFSVFYKPHK